MFNHKNPWSNNIIKGLTRIIICYAYITGFVFYFIIELLPKEKVKVVVLRLVCNNVTQISSRMDTLLLQSM